MQKQVACAKRRNLAEPPPAHLEGDKRRTGGGLEVICLVCLGSDSWKRITGS